MFTISRIYDLYRMNLIEKTSENLQDLADEYNVDYEPRCIYDTLKVIDYIEKYNNGKHGKIPMMIDYTDMLWLVYKNIDPINFPKYDVLFVDECLPYHMPILLADGTSLPIGKIVDKKLNINVLTYNVETGKQEFKKIINWSKSLNNKKMYKIKGHNKSDHNIRSFVVCTFNHKIYVRVLDLFMLKMLSQE